MIDKILITIIALFVILFFLFYNVFGIFSSYINPNNITEFSDNLLFNM